MDLNQQKERLKRELARLEQKEKHLKKQAEAKNIKAITAEILKYDIPKYNNFKKLVGLLTYFDCQNEDFKNGIITRAENELKERKDKKIARTLKKI
ncbi:hypothetical protein AAHU66_03710 [Klebsiella pneumoniae]|uniref:Mobilization protein n=3 Tax=Enterobacteriaceae TaxID=543 RepID=A0ABZ2DZE7_RAOOR|nr:MULTISPECIES: hypothetical protein [Enterobacteriaceae]HAT2206892.1 hypothetical protein [Kluyvera intermedia]HAT2278801.1 hypothetical protein [Raoultella ornithinolytica]AKL15183.1 hypothetical protein AB182_29645 [Phytobacter ursingii]EJK5917562.1 hypothetical protein [Escherichia coli]ELO7118827.1 hypothetical protein [Escherichia coli]